MNILTTINIVIKNVIFDKGFKTIKEDCALCNNLDEEESKSDY